MRFIRGDSLADLIPKFHAADAQDHDAGKQMLELRKLLGRFIDVCNAIEYAHSRGVLHRDLKPGNIMLGKYGETLVVDWGLAKSVQTTDQSRISNAPRYRGPNEEPPLVPTSGSGSAPTQMGSALGTPAYMSPEQVAGRLDELGPSTDVYSLGATLYHLLTGQPPIHDGAADVGEILRKVQRGDVPSPRSLRRSIPKPLEAICLKAMAVRSEDRYASAIEIASDVERWLADEAVLAYREPLSARVARWARRNRGWTQGAAAALVLVTVISVVATLQVNRARTRERRALSSQQAVSRFFTGLFEEDGRWALPEFRIRPRVANLTAKQLLEMGYGRVQKELLDHPAARADFLESIGNVYRDLGMYEQATDILRESLQLRGLHEADDLGAIGLTMRNLAWSLHYSGAYEEAQVQYEQALELLEGEYGSNDAEVATTKLQFGILLSDDDVREFDRALSFLNEAIEARMELFGSKDQSVAIAHTAKAAALFNKGDERLAAISVKDAAEIWAAEQGRNNPGKALSEHYAGLAALANGDYAEAVRLLEASAHPFGEIFGEDHPYFALALIPYAEALVANGQYEQAEREIMRAEAIVNAAAIREDHPKRLNIRNVFVQLYLKTKRGDLAIKLIDDYRALTGDLHGADSRQYADACKELAVALLELSRPHDALEQMQWALDAIRHAASVRPDEIAAFEEKLGMILTEVGNLAEAIVVIQRAGARRINSKADRSAVADNDLLLGQVQLKGGQIESAILSLESAKKGFLQYSRSDWATRAKALLGEAHFRDGQTELAEQELIEAKTTIDAMTSRPQEWTIHVRQTLAELYRKTGRPEKAAEYESPPKREIDPP
jgi:tetratricopeptide (TPR) repeat protein